MGLRSDFYMEMRAMETIYKAQDRAAMRLMMEPHTTEGSGTSIIIVTSKESGEMIGVNLETRSIERGMIFTEQIRSKANEIAMQYCGWRTSYDMVDMFARLEEIGITVPVQENSGRNLHFQYKGRFVPGCILVFDKRNVDSENDRREYMVYFS